ncbi:hypothetical protein LP419_10510 [Massilia sp. H-1]|nr:hypothetical protein LP419_10510 [Massilia sp. H-1]
MDWSADGATAYMLCNPKAPGTYEVCAVNAKDGKLREVTALEGVEQFALSPDQRKLLVHYSSSYMPVQLATVPVMQAGAAARLTDTRSADFKAQQLDRTANCGRAIDPWRGSRVRQAVSPGHAGSGPQVPDRHVRAWRQATCKT